MALLLSLVTFLACECVSITKYKENKVPLMLSGLMVLAAFVYICASYILGAILVAPIEPSGVFLRYTVRILGVVLIGGIFKVLLQVFQNGLRSLLGVKPYKVRFKNCCNFRNKN